LERLAKLSVIKHDIIRFLLSKRRRYMNICIIKSFAVVLAAAAIVGLGLAECSSSGTSAPATKTCAELNGMVIPSASIDLPTTGGTVTSTTLVPAAGTGTAAVGEYCKVLGEINPVDPT
jgi:hypothetical protein